MNQIVKTLPFSIPSNVVYDGVMVEHLVYDPIEKAYTCRVYAMCRGMAMPLILSTAVTVHRIEQVTVTDAEIDAIQTAHPEITDRLDAAMVRAFARLSALASETLENPYNA